MFHRKAKQFLGKRLGLINRYNRVSDRLFSFVSDMVSVFSKNYWVVCASECACVLDSVTASFDSFYPIVHHFLDYVVKRSVDSVFSD